MDVYDWRRFWVKVAAEFLHSSSEKVRDDNERLRGERKAW